MAKRLSRARRIDEITATVPYTQTTSTELFTLPKGARIIDWIINVKTALTGGTTTLNVGTNTTSNYFISAVSCAAVGKAAPTISVPGHETTAVTPVHASVGASNTAGSIDVTCIFSMEEASLF